MLCQGAACEAVYRAREARNGVWREAKLWGSERCEAKLAYEAKWYEAKLWEAKWCEAEECEVTWCEAKWCEVKLCEMESEEGGIG